MLAFFQVCFAAQWKSLTVICSVSSLRSTKSGLSRWDCLHRVFTCRFHSIFIVYVVRSVFFLSCRRKSGIDWNRATLWKTRVPWCSSSECAAFFIGSFLHSVIDYFDKSSSVDYTASLLLSTQHKVTTWEVSGRIALVRLAWGHCLHRIWMQESPAHCRQHHPQADEHGL